MKLRLEIDIEYEGIDDPSEIEEATKDDLRRRLHKIADHAASVGQFTDDLGAYVEHWESRVLTIKP